MRNDHWSGVLADLDSIGVGGIESEGLAEGVGVVDGRRKALNGRFCEL